MKPQSLPARLLTAVVLLALILAPTLADAGPKWRLRRWSSRPPIDPTIRTTTSFRRSPAASSGRIRYSAGASYAFRAR